MNRIFHENENRHISTTDEIQEYLTFHEKNEHEEDFENEFLKKNIHDSILLFAFIFVYTQQYVERMSLIFIYFFFLYRENQASSLSNKNFQIFQYVNNVETFNSKLRDMTYISSNIISQ